MDNNLNLPLVSLIIPCYNMGTKIHRLLNSILEQTYTKIQVIIVDDGSTDNSSQIINSYRDKFTEKGIIYEYIYKENQGLGAAINTGLKLIKGEYFCWPDADDYLTNDSIEKKLKFLETNRDYGFVRSDAAVYFETDLKYKIGCISRKSPNRFKETNLMEDYILGKDVIFCPGCHMIKTAAFKTVNPKMDIYEGKRGQDYQLLLPMLYKYKFGYIDECLYNYIIYQNSMSRGDDTFQKCKTRHDELFVYIIETLKRIDMPAADFDYYSKLAKENSFFLNAISAFNFGLKHEYDINRRQITNENLINRIKTIDTIRHIPLGFYFKKISYKIKKIILRNKIIYKILRNDKIKI